MEFPTPKRHAVPVFVGYPAPYRVGMSNLGLHFLYGRLRQSPALRVERFFSDSCPVTIESGSPVSSAAVLLFSVSYEEDYLNLVRMLVRSGVQPIRNGRTGAAILIAGGPAVSANPLPLSGIVDAVAVGEGERPLDAIVDLLERSPELDREWLLAGLAATPGLFVPELSSGRIAPAPHATADELVRSVVVTPDTVFSDTVLVESARGCPGTCAFCLATAIYRPFRPRPAQRIIRFIDSIPGLVRKVGLVSAAAAAHPEFDEIVSHLAERGISVGLGSLRAEDIDDATAGLIGRAGVRSVSLAPESGSETLRASLGKGTPDAIFFRAADALHRFGVRAFSLYLLTGLPGEDSGTLIETEAFLNRFRAVVGTSRCSVHVNVLVPKALTPLQFHPMPLRAELEMRLAQIARIARKAGFAVRSKSPRSALRQAVLSLGDERIGKSIVRHITGGISWRGALAGEGIDEGFLHRPRGLLEPLPWDSLRDDALRERLLERYELITRRLS